MRYVESGWEPTTVAVTAEGLARFLQELQRLKGWASHNRTDGNLFKRP